MAASPQITVDQLISLYEIEAGNESRIRFAQELKALHSRLGTTRLLLPAYSPTGTNYALNITPGSEGQLNLIPVIGGKAIDLASIFELVQRFGWSTAVCTHAVSQYL